MPWIRRASTTVTAEGSIADNIVAEALTNNDGQERQIYGALLSVIAGNDTISSQEGISAFWSSQSVTDGAIQQGFDFGDMAADRRQADEARSGPFSVVQTSGRNDAEQSETVHADFGHPDNYIPWPDGAQMHLGLVALSDTDNGSRAHGVLYYQEGAGGL